MLLGNVSKIKTGNLDVNAKVRNGRYPFFTCAQKSEKIDSYSFDCECVLVAGNGDLNIKHYKGKFDAYQRTYVVEILQKNQLDARFLFHFLNKYLEKLRNQSIGGVIKYIKMANLTDIKLPNYSLEKQKQIVEILDTADSLRKKRKEQLTILDDYIKSVFLEMFGDPVMNNKAWSNHELSDLSTKIGSGATPRGGKSSYKNEGVALIRSMNIQNNMFEYKGLAYIDDMQAENLRNVIVQENDVLFNITGASVCRCAIVPKEILPARVNQHVAIIHPNKKVNSVYLSLLLTSGSFKSFLLRLASAGGATREAITKEDLGKLSIPVPPIDLQNKFADIVKQVEQTKQKMRTSLEEMDNHFNALMQRWFG